jgi:hypothetical protein
VTEESASAPPISVPDLLQGAWTSMLVLTYGVDLGFLERRLLSQLHRVPLRVVLADAGRLTRRYQEAARTGQRLSMANRTCLIGPIRHHRAAHAKAIFLSNPTEGLLLVGSGNLGHDGYASPGELWHVFAYRDDRREHLAEFMTLRHLVDGLAQSEALDPPTSQVLDLVWTHSTWLPAPDSYAPAAVRHNVQSPLIEQLADAVDFDVDIATLYAPFHDPDCAAVSAVLNRFRPKRLRLLVTRDTSVHTDRLDEIIAATDGSTCEHLEIGDDPATFVHAKWIHLAGARREAMLTGSANLSRSALLSAAAHGNVELGIISVRDAGGFDDLYEPLNLTELASPSELDLSFHSDADEVDDPAAPSLLWSRLDRSVLTLAFTFLAPDIALSLTASDRPVGIIRVDRNDATLTVLLDAADAARLADGGPIWVSLSGQHAMFTVTWPYQLSTLKARLERTTNRDLLAKTGALPEEDAELLLVLRELEGTLIFDTVTAWRVANAGGAAEPLLQDHSSIRWEDLDWDRIRRDPRYGAYQYRGSRGAIEHTDIEVVLASIAGRLGPLGDDSLPSDDDLALPGDTTTADDAEEHAERDDGRPLGVATRTRMAINRFVARYAAATRDTGFTDKLGPTLAVHNAAIFVHVVFQLLLKDAVDPGRAVSAHVAAWELLWGKDSDDPGLIAVLTGEERAAALRVLEEARTRATVLRALSHIAGMDLPTEVERDLRDLVRHLVTSDDFDLDAEFVGRSGSQSEQTLAQLRSLSRITSFPSNTDVASYVVAPLGLEPRDVEWKVDEVRRADPSTGKGRLHRSQTLVIRRRVDGLDCPTIRHALGRFVAATDVTEPNRDYWRIKFDGHTGCVGYWDEAAGRGLAVADSEEEDFFGLNPAWPEWTLRLRSLEARVSSAVSA